MNINWTNILSSDQKLKWFVQETAACLSYDAALKMKCITDVVIQHCLFRGGCLKLDRLDLTFIITNSGTALMFRDGSLETPGSVNNMWEQKAQLRTKRRETKIPQTKHLELKSAASFILLSAQFYCCWQICLVLKVKQTGKQSDGVLIFFFF